MNPLGDDTGVLALFGACTAIVLLALVRYPDEPGARDMIRRGRAFLIATQEHEGNWKETTRPPGAGSYAQRLSTTGWATLALLEPPDTHTNPKRQRGTRLPLAGASGWCGGGLTSAGSRRRPR